MLIKKNKVENKDQNVYNEENVLVYLAMRKDIVYNSGQRIGDLVWTEESLGCSAFWAIDDESKGHALYSMFEWSE